MTGPDDLTQYTICRSDTVYRWARKGGGWSEPYFAYEHAIQGAQFDYEQRILSALTVNTSTPGNDLEYNGLAATRMEQLEKRVLKLELILSRMEPSE